MNERQQVIDTTRVVGYVPVYGTPDNKDIVTTTARNIADPGKIYAYGEYLLVNEKGKAFMFLITQIQPNRLTWDSFNCSVTLTWL